MRRTLALAAITAAFLLLSAISVATPHASAASTLTWTACDGGFECATLKVPLDYSNAGGQQIDLGLVRSKVTDPTKRVGSLLMNPGGPGASAIDLVESLGPGLSASIREKFDLVGFDPRGVGRSTPVVCHDNLQAYFAADPQPDTDAKWQTIDAVAHAFADGCKAKAGSLLPYLGTRNVARDMEQVRIALGEDKLNYLGFSYGTVIGAVYADMYPTKIRAMVLDGAFDFYSQSGDEGLRFQSIGFENALKAYAADCIAQSCALTTRGDPLQVIDGLFAAVKTAPVPAPNADRPAGPGETELGISLALYAKSLWPRLTQAVDSELSGDGTRMVRLADAYLERNQDGSYPNLQEIYLGVECLDNTWPANLAAFQALAPKHSASAPHFGLPNLLQSALPCPYWPAPPQPLTAPVASGAPPILVVATTNDPATPYDQGVAVSKQLKSGVLLTHVGEGHTVYASGQSVCVDNLVNDYILNLKTAASGSSCTDTSATPTPPTTTSTTGNPTATATASASPSPTSTATATASATASPTFSATASPTATATRTASPSPTATPTALPPTATPAPPTAPPATATAPAQPSVPAPLPPNTGTGTIGRGSRESAWFPAGALMAFLAGAGALALVSSKRRG